MRRFLAFPLLCALLQLPGYVTVASAQTRAVAPRITDAADETRLVTLRGNTHTLARPQFDQGAAPPALLMERMRLVLTRGAEQEYSLKALLDAQQDKASPSFHQWLTPEQFGQQFGPADQDIQAITSWLQSHGFQVNHVSEGKTVIAFSGTAGQVLDAFHTEIHKFVANGEEHWANASDPQIPVALEPVVAGITGLHNFRAKSMIERSGQWSGVAPPGGFRPQYNQPDGSHALAPADFATIYNVNPLYKAGINGSGVTIGVLGVGPISVKDIADFRRAFHLPNNPPQVITNGTATDYFMAGGNDVEGTLDVSWAGAVAPNATVTFITSAFTDTTDGLTLSEEYAVDNNVADVLTESFGLCESDFTQADTQMINSIRQQAAVQGITFVVASGDEGAYSCYGESSPTATGPLSVNGLASSPYAIAVGGTEFSGAIKASSYWAATNKSSTLASALSYIPETGWNDSCSAAQCGAINMRVAASGGGASKLFHKPAWQSGVVGIPSDGARDLPDVSLAASEVDAPYPICFSGGCAGSAISSNSFMFLGGTSASTPSFAGVMALVIQKTKSRQGQANYVLYRLAASQQYSKCDGSNPKTLPDSNCVFNDITSGNNAVPGEPKFGSSGALYQAGVGYDLTTGLGSLNVANLVNRWNSVAFNSTETTLALSPTKLNHGDAANVQIAVTSPSGTGAPTGDVSLVTVGGTGGVFSLNGGAVTSTTASLPGGTYNVTAHYAGDGTFASSDSAPVTVTVSPEASTTTAVALVVPDIPDSSYTSGTYGNASVGLSARVTGRSGHGSPTGTVTFTDNGTPIGGGPGILDVEGEAISENNGIVLPPGRHSIVATYGGDAGFQPSASLPAVVTIAKAQTALYVQPSLNNVQSGKPVTLTATVEGGSAPFGNPATGTVTFFLGGKPLGTPVSVAAALPNVTATLTTSTLPMGANNITATYGGDGNYLGSTSQQPAVVTVGTQSASCAVTNFTASPNPITLYDTPGTTTISAAAGCQADIRSGSPSGKLLGTGTKAFSAAANSVSDGMTFYLQVHGDTTPKGTLQKLTVHVQSGTLPCVVFSFAAAPNPIISPSLVGSTTITALASTVVGGHCNFDIRLDSPNGGLFATGQDTVVAPTANWVTNGKQFFLQQHGDTTPQGTLASLTVAVLASAPLCVVADFSANPNPIVTSSSFGTTTINVDATCAFDIRAGSVSGTVFTSGIGSLSAATGPWVSDGMTFYLQLHGDSTPNGTLGKLTVAVHP